MAAPDAPARSLPGPAPNAGTQEPRRGGPLPAALRGLRPVLLLIGAVTAVAALHLGRPLLLPLAVAGLLTFLLAPIVRLFERGMPRPAAVVVVVILTFSALSALGWVLVVQVTGLTGEIPTYRENLKRKIADVRGASRGSVIDEVQTATKEVVEELQKSDQPAQPTDRPVPVVVKAPPVPLAQLPVILEALGNLGLVLVLVIFMLLERLQIRDRVIRVIGFGRLAATTKAIDEAAQRISRYLSTQTIINGSFGLGVALGTMAIGLPYAFVWGALAGVLRFIPYVGPWAGAVLVSLAGLAVFEGWVQPLLIAALFIVLELFTNLVLETYLYSQSAGVSQVALLLAVAFWTWVWGPIGLALATPLTVCLLVMAKHVPDLEILTILLSDEPVLGPDRRFYQRLLARDEEEAAQLVEEYLRTHSVAELHDLVLLPALSHAQRDHGRDRIDDADLDFIDAATARIVERLPSVAEEAPAEALVVGLPARSEADRLALVMLGQAPAPGHWRLEIASPDLLASEIVDLVEQREPAVVVVGALGGAAHALQLRYLCKRVRARFPALPIVLGWWGAEIDAQTRAELSDAGADRVALTLAEARGHVLELVRLERPAAPPADLHPSPVS